MLEETQNTLTISRSHFLRLWRKEASHIAIPKSFHELVVIHSSECFYGIKDSLPDTLYLQMDNCARENKNRIYNISEWVTPFLNSMRNHSIFNIKTIHLSNGSFLPLGDNLRNSEGFGLNEGDTNNIPEGYSRNEEIQKRMEYNTLLNNNQKLKHQKQTGLKGTYNVMKISYYDSKSKTARRNVTLADLEII
uniref:DUF7869 domain-containing protein n=1 Tax=Magallana gigas TaxID=29159 RepID=A0A8W8MTB2_MAGGI